MASSLILLLLFCAFSPFIAHLPGPRVLDLLSEIATADAAAAGGSEIARPSILLLSFSLSLFHPLYMRPSVSAISRLEFGSIAES